MNKVNRVIWSAVGEFAIILAMVVYLSHPSVTMAAPMAGYGLPACASEDDAPAGGCVWQPGDGPVWINYPGRT